MATFFVGALFAYAVFVTLMWGVAITRWDEEHKTRKRAFAELGKIDPNAVTRIVREGALEKDAKARARRAEKAAKARRGGK